MTTHSLTVRNLSVETYEGIKVFAKAQGKSVESYLRTLLDQSVRAPDRIKLGSLIQAQGKTAGHSDFDSDFDFSSLRDKSSYAAPDLS